jgi:hypothetical protein
MAQLRPRLTYANVMATLGVFLALGGSAWAVAANSIGTKALKAGAVTTPKIRNRAVTEAKLATGAVTRGKVANGAINGRRIANGSLSGVDIKSSTLGTVPFAASAAHAVTADSTDTVLTTPGLVKQTAAPAPGNKITLVQKGPFKIQATCESTTTPGEVIHVLAISTTEDHSRYFIGDGFGAGHEFSPTVPAFLDDTLYNSPAQILNTRWSVVAPSGSTLSGVSQSLVKTYNADCASAVSAVT